MTLLQIYHWICQWKNCENQLTFGGLWARVSVLFSRLPVYLAHSSVIVHTGSGRPKTSSQKFLKRWKKISTTGLGWPSCPALDTPPIPVNFRRQNCQFTPPEDTEVGSFVASEVNWAIKQQDPNADYSRVAVIAQWNQNSASAQGSVHTHNRCSGDVQYSRAVNAGSVWTEQPYSAVWHVLVDKCPITKPTTSKRRTKEVKETKSKDYKHR